MRTELPMDPFNMNGVAIDFRSRILESGADRSALYQGATDEYACNERSRHCNSPWIPVPAGMTTHCAQLSAG